MNKIISLLFILLVFSCHKQSSNKNEALKFMEKSGRQAPFSNLYRFVDIIDTAEIKVPYNYVNEQAENFKNHFGFLSEEYLSITKNVAMGDKENTIEVKRAVFAPVPSNISFSLRVPEQAVLEISIGIMSDRHKQKHGDAHFLVYIKDSKGIKKLIDERISEVISINDKWTNFALNLNEYVDCDVTISLITEGQNGTLALWGNPILRGKRKDPQKPSNIIMIAIDTFRRDYVSIYNAKFKTTPRIDEIALKGVRFDQAISNSNWSRPSYFSIFTGKMPGRLGVPINRFSITSQETDYFYKYNKMTLPTILKKNGYISKTIGNNYFIVQDHIREGVGQLGLDLGFDSVVNHNQKEGKDAEMTLMDVEKTIESYKNTNFFLFISFDNAHFPYEPPKKYLKMWTECEGCEMNEPFRYRGTMAYVDELIGRIYEKLISSGLDKNSIIIFFADHGENFDPAHDYTVPRHGLGNIDMCRTINDHGASIYDEVLRVPLIFTGRDFKNNFLSEKQVQLIDLFPTILELAGVDITKIKFDGHSLTPFLYGKDAAGSPVVISEGFDMKSVRTSGYHYIIHEDSVRQIIRHKDGQDMAEDLKEQLFNVTEDPEEHVNLAFSKPEIVKELRTIMDQHFNERLYGLHMRFIGEKGKKHTFSGEISTKGVFTRVELYRNEASDHIDIDLNRQNISFNLHVDEEDDDGIVFLHSPSEAEVKFNIKLDHKNLSRTQTATGCFGMRFDINNAEITSLNQWKQFVCETPPKYDLADGPKLILYKKEETFIRKDMPVEPAMKKLLKDWGYIHEE